MRIGIDARWIFDKISGIGRYTRNLIGSLAEIDHINDYVIFFDDYQKMRSKMEEMDLKGRENFKGEVVPYGLFSIENMRKLPRLLDRLRLDIYHSTNFMAPLKRSKCKLVITVHDLIPYLFPKFVPRSKKRKLMPFYRILMRKIIKRADGIIAVSNNTRTDILRCFKIPARKVAVVYNGIEDRYFAESVPVGNAELKKKFHIRGKMILSVGRADPYKNVLGLVQAFGQLIEQNAADYSLVLVGEEDPRYPEIRRFVEENRLSERVFFAGYLDDKGLLAAYREADLVVHPSLYEGLGYPPLEAMACGTPVISSDRASLPEVLGKAAVYVDPEDPEQMAKAISKTLADAGQRNRLIADGRSRARCFPLEKMAKETVQFYRRCYRGSNQAA